MAVPKPELIRVCQSLGVPMGIVGRCIAKGAIVNGIDRHLTVVFQQVVIQLGASTVVNDSSPGGNVPGGFFGRRPA